MPLSPIKGRYKGLLTIAQLRIQFVEGIGSELGRLWLFRGRTAVRSYDEVKVDRDQVAFFQSTPARYSIF